MNYKMVSEVWVVHKSLEKSLNIKIQLSILRKGIQKIKICEFLIRNYNQGNELKEGRLLTKWTLTVDACRPARHRGTPVHNLCRFALNGHKLTKKGGVGLL